jgi:hypothetical protein
MVKMTKTHPMIVVLSCEAPTKAIIREAMRKAFADPEPLAQSEKLMGDGAHAHAVKNSSG